MRKLLLVSASLGVAALALFSPLDENALSQAIAHRTQTVPAPVAHKVATHLQREGYWHTQGGRILNASGAPVRISGMNWSGLETPEAVPGGLKLQDYRTILRSVAAAGYNTVRLPYSSQMVEQPGVPSEIAFANEHGAINSDLEGLNSLQIMDRIVAAAGELGLKVILDNHRSEAGSSAEANGLWYAEGYPESSWIADWVALAERYRGNPTVIGFDLRNEPHNATQGGACWDCGGDHDWHLAAQRAGNAVLRANSNLLIFVEGTDQYDGSSYWWGGNLAGVRHSPVRLAVANRLVYSTHVYGPTEYSQSWFSAATTPASLEAIWQRNWAFIPETGVAPVWIGEFGTTNEPGSVASMTAGSEGQWFQTLVGYLRKHREIGWTYWGVNGEDRYGYLNSSYEPAPGNEQKALALASIRMPTMAEATLTTEEARMGAPAAVGPLGERVQPDVRMTVAVPAPEIASAAQLEVAELQRRSAGLSRAGLPMMGGASAGITSGPRMSGAARHVVARNIPATNVELTVAEQVRRATQQALQGLPPQAE